MSADNTEALKSKAVNFVMQLANPKATGFAVAMAGIEAILEYHNMTNDIPATRIAVKRFRVIMETNINE